MRYQNEYETLNKQENDSKKTYKKKRYENGVKI